MANIRVLNYSWAVPQLYDKQIQLQLFAIGKNDEFNDAKVHKRVSVKMVTKCAYYGYTYADVWPYKASLIIISISMLILALPAMLLNGSILITIYRKTRFHLPVYYIISNLALTDFLASTFAYTAYAAVCLVFVLNRDGCSLALIVAPFSYLLGFVSYQTVVYQALERYIAIFYPLWYHERFHRKYALLGVAIVWIISGLSTSLWFSVKDSIGIDLYFGITSMVDLLVVVLCHSRIFWQVKKTQRQISQQVVNSDERKKFMADSRVARVTGIILSAFLLCYLAELTMLSLSSTLPRGKAQFGVLQYWSWFFCLANSTINPIILLHQLRTLRRSVAPLWGTTMCASVLNVESQSTLATNSRPQQP